MFKGLVNRIKIFIKNNPKISILAIIVFFAFYIFITIESFHFSSAPGFCERCHPEKNIGPLSEVHTWRQNIHSKAGVLCLDCHGEPGVLGYMKAKMGGLKDVYGEFLKPREYKLEILTKGATDPIYASKLVPNNICLFCHSDEYNQRIRKERLMSVGVKFREIDTIKNPEYRKSFNLPDILSEKIRSEIDPNHKKHLEKNVNCVECHLGVVHGGEFKNKVDLKRCTECHVKKAGEISMSDIKIGTSEMAVTFSHKKHSLINNCNNCHTELFQMKKGTTKITFADHSSNKACYSCHNGKQAFSSLDCNKCHSKLSLPTQILIGKTDSAVKFNHSSHAKKSSCNDCHDKLFLAKKGSNKITFADHNSNKSCYACHNGKKSFGVENCSACHTKIPVPKETLHYKLEGLSPAHFSHDFHSKIFNCKDCHDKYFVMKKGGSKMNMQGMYEGKYCGACHNGKLGFSINECAKCHYDKK